MPTIVENGKPIQLTLSEYAARNERLKSALPLNPDGTFRGVAAEKLDTVKINGEVFSGVSELTTVNTKTYVDEPGRSNDGSMPDINEYDTFSVPRLKVNFKYFTIDDYRRFCLAVAANEFPVEYFDKQFGKRVTHKMYCEPLEKHKIHAVNETVIGVLDCEISLIGTLNDAERFTLRYDPNGAAIAKFRGEYSASDTYCKGDRVLYHDVYKEAIYYVDSFKGVSPPNTEYWELILVTEWHVATTYRKNDVVRVTDPDDAAKVSYYLAVFEGSFSGKPVSDHTYWQSVTISDYKAEQTYRMGDLAKLGVSFYRAVYYKDDFTGKSPIDFAYWAGVPELNGETYDWGKSALIAAPETLFAQPDGKTFDRYNASPDGTDFNYYPKQSTSIFGDVTLYAIWREV